MPAILQPEFIEFCASQNAPESAQPPGAALEESSRNVMDSKTTNIGLNAILAHLYFVWHLLRGLRPPPFHVEVCPTSACPLQIKGPGCTFCSYNARNKRGHGLSNEVLEQIADDMQDLGSKGAYLSGGGDPLMASGIAGFIEKIAGFTSIAIQTNAVALGKLLKLGSEWFNAMIDLVSWSVYAHDAELFQAVCRSRPNVHGVIRANMLRAAEFRGQWRSGQREFTPVHLSGKIVLCRENYSQVVELRKYAESFDLDTCQVVLVDNFEPGQDVALTHDQLVKLVETLTTSECARDDEVLGALGNRLARPSIRLPVPQYTILEGQVAIIETNGDVYVSIPSDGDTRFVIGNVYKERLRDMWWGPRHREVVSRLSRTFFPVAKDRHYSRDLAVHAFVTGQRGFPLGKADLAPDRVRQDLRVQL